MSDRPTHARHSAAQTHRAGGAREIACEREPGGSGCHYVDDRSAGIGRIRSGRGFRYLGSDGRPVTQTSTLDRIRRLAIPPAWKSVWICPDPNGHIQATGRDARGRKQYRYHARFRAHRDQTKYDRMLEFAKYLPKIRMTVDQHLERPGLDRYKVLATVVRLLEISLIRIGNEEYARANGSFGLTTMRARHVDIHGSTIRFHFRGKSGVHHEIAVHDRRLAKVVQRCHDLPGQELFQDVDENGERSSIDASDVNEYLRTITHGAFTAKDFRTWAGTVLMSRTLRAMGPSRSRRAANKNVVAAAKDVARQLGNTASVCRRCYVHPVIFAAYVEGALRPLAGISAAPSKNAAANSSPGIAPALRGGAMLSHEERAVVALLRARSAELEVGANAA